MIVGRKSYKRRRRNRKSAEILGVPEDADERTLKAAYRKMALQYHRDKWKSVNMACPRQRRSSKLCRVLTITLCQSLRSLEVVWWYPPLSLEIFIFSIPMAAKSSEISFLDQMIVKL
jgi:hypothetical protein